VLESLSRDAVPVGLQAFGDALDEACGTDSEADEVGNIGDDEHSSAEPARAAMPQPPPEGRRLRLRFKQPPPAAYPLR
jgi:hypothetical protein